MADETGVEGIAEAFYNLIGETMQRAEQTLDVVGAQVQLGDFLPGLDIAAKVAKGVATGR
ncbi:hypothetical protein [Embleya scabrispora]|uniref:hypothetical protein n=1 Tax=Embleya scabrispora TaxID=159449 RepID=UPI0003656F0E|nr:hypothetical protein [Embleya scabrispora]MYS87376.1 hypothetical protein [Streptomyces sp. SID5474]